MNELTVNKHLKDAQQLTFLQCTHMDHCFQEFANDNKKRFEELAGVNWTYILNSDEEVLNNQVKRLTMYIEYELGNLLKVSRTSIFGKTGFHGVKFLSLRI